MITREKLPHPPPIFDWGELRRPWKLITFAVGTALMLIGAVLYEISDWDFGISLLMPALTYLTAPWAVRVLMQRHWRWLPLAAFWAWFTIDGVYWFYHTLVGNEMLRLENALTSTPMYFGMGFFWYPRMRWGDLLAIARGGVGHETPAPNRRPISLQRTLLAFAFGGLIWSLCVEVFWLDVTHHRLGTPHSEKILRVVQISDLHHSRWGWRERQVLDHLRQLKPDVLVLTGDYLERPEDLPAVVAFVANLPKVPAVAVLGNWERMSGVDLSALFSKTGAHGIRWLVNESAVLDTPEGRLRVTGLDDAFSGDPDWERAMRGVPTDERLSHLVLQHTPVWRESLLAALEKNPRRAPLAMLAGHTHGGQVNFWGWHPALPPGSGPYVAGWSREVKNKNAVPLYISRGIGVSVLPLRFGVRPEIAVFEVGLN